MKNILIISSFLSLLLLSDSFMTSTPADDSGWLERSEIRFCESRGYDPDNMTPEQWDEFNDCWRGSVEEENAMNND